MNRWITVMTILFGNTGSPQISLKHYLVRWRGHWHNISFMGTRWFPIFPDEGRDRKFMLGTKLSLTLFFSLHKFERTLIYSSYLQHRDMPPASVNIMPSNTPAIRNWHEPNKYYIEKTLSHSVSLAKLLCCCFFPFELGTLFFSSWPTSIRIIKDA